MEFINLAEALENMAYCVEVLPHFEGKTTDLIGKISEKAANDFWGAHDEKIEWARKIGFAAKTLNKAWHDSSNTPLQWMEYDEAKGFAVRSDYVKQEGIDMLTHATRWGNRELSNCATHFRNAITQGDDALAMPVLRGVDDGLTIDGKMLRLMRVGFDRSELVLLLNSKGIEHTLTPQAESVRDANGGKRGKKDKKTIDERVCQLHVLFWKVRNYLITKNKLRTEMDIWTELEKNHREHDNEEIIEKIEDGYIEWVSRWGNKDTFNKSSLSATISVLKNNPPFKI
ncbi:MAG: hypothetical protein NTY50_17660 [Methylobacter sp.]|nr:hypothetical protein [Methylobacter sp.]